MEQNMTFEQTVEATKLKEGDVITGQSFYELTDAVRANAEAKLQLRLKQAEDQIATIEDTIDNAKLEKATAATSIQSMAHERIGAVVQAITSQLHQWSLEGDAIGAKVDAAKDEAVVKGSGNLESTEIKNLEAQVDKAKADKAHAATKARHLYGKTLELLQDEMKDQMRIWKADLDEMSVKLGAVDAKAYGVAQKVNVKSEMVQGHAETLCKKMEATFKGWYAEVIALDKHVGNWADQAGADLHAERIHLRDTMKDTLEKWSVVLEGFKAKRVAPEADSQITTDLNLMVEEFVEDLMAEDKAYLKPNNKDTRLDKAAFEKLREHE